MENLHARDLRIGNYYNQFGNIHQANGGVISELEKAPEGQLWCKPIPLTEKWLLKMGFESEIGADCLFLKIEMSDVKIRFDKFGIRIGFAHYYRTPYVKYVHQLQNLYYALTNEELKISL